MPPTPSLPKCGTCRWHTLQIELKSIARNVSRLIRLDLWMSFGSLDNEHLLMDVNGMWRLPWSTPLQTSDPTLFGPKTIDLPTFRASGGSLRYVPPFASKSALASASRSTTWRWPASDHKTAKSANFMQLPIVQGCARLTLALLAHLFRLPEHVDILQLSLGKAFSNLSRSELRTQRSGAPSLPCLWLQYQLLKPKGDPPPPSPR